MCAQKGSKLVDAEGASVEGILCREARKERFVWVLDAVGDVWEVSGVSYIW